MSEKIPLTDNFLFKAIFSEHEDMLLDLLNSFPKFQNEKMISKIKVLNPELPKATELEKLSILDIHAFRRQTSPEGVCSFTNMHID